jgi:hypothetical protein
MPLSHTAQIQLDLLLTTSHNDRIILRSRLGSRTHGGKRKEHAHAFGDVYMGRQVRWCGAIWKTKVLRVGFLSAYLLCSAQGDRIISGLIGQDRCSDLFSSVWWQVRRGFSFKRKCRGFLILFTSFFAWGFNYIMYIRQAPKGGTKKKAETKENLDKVLHGPNLPAQLSLLCWIFDPVSNLFFLRNRVALKLTNT